MMIADVVYGVPAVVILNSAQKAVSGWDLITSMIKSWVFGTIIATVGLHFPPPVLYCNSVLVSQAIQSSVLRNSIHYFG